MSRQRPSSTSAAGPSDVKAAGPSDVKGDPGFMRLKGQVRQTFTPTEMLPNERWANGYTAGLAVAVASELAYASLNAGASEDELNTIFAELGASNDASKEAAHWLGLSIGGFAIHINVVQFHLRKLALKWSQSYSPESYTRNMVAKAGDNILPIMLLTPYALVGGLADVLYLPQFQQGPGLLLTTIICAGAIFYYIGFDGPKLKPTALRQVNNYLSQMSNQGEYSLATTALVESFTAAFIRGFTFSGIFTKLNEGMFNNWFNGPWASAYVGANTGMLAFLTRNAVAKNMVTGQLLRRDMVDRFAAEKTNRECFLTNIHPKIFLHTLLNTVPFSIPLYLLLDMGSLPLSFMLFAFFQRGLYRGEMRRQLMEAESDSAINNPVVDAAVKARGLAKDLQAMIDFIQQEDPQYLKIQQTAEAFGRIGDNNAFMSDLKTLTTSLVREYGLAELFFNETNRTDLIALLNISRRLLDQFSSIPSSRAEHGNKNNYMEGERARVHAFIAGINYTLSAILTYLDVSFRNLDQVPSPLNISKAQSNPVYKPKCITKGSVMFSGLFDLMGRTLSGVLFFDVTMQSMGLTESRVRVPFSLWLSAQMVINTWVYMVDKDAMEVTGDYAAAIKNAACFIGRGCRSSGSSSVRYNHLAEQSSAGSHDDANDVELDVSGGAYGTFGGNYTAAYANNGHQ